ncbi:MAG: hypothetical protein CVT49_11880 [candidate division Zixibacteria bacterium HGW-Zixibacteria-1]|nr:MAG: hypothetical protein CVT49_11880 [candidate division Zixibacteria bacterium HGW-Zixibacteria-1]
MNNKLTGYVIAFFLFTIIILISCATLGSKVRVQQPETLKQLKCIVLTEPVLTQKSGETVTAATDETWHELVDTRFLYALEENGLVDFICDDDLKDVINNATKDQADLDRYHQAIERPVANAEAILKTKMEIRLKDDNKGDSYVTMQLHDANTGGIILEIEFNTMWGKGYVNKPTTLMTIRDGISGAVKLLADQLRK